MTQQAVQPGTATPATGSTLAYLFADRFVLKEAAGKTGMKAFGTGQVVVTRELSAGLVAIALWQLRERGAVTLEAYSAKKLGFISTSGVRVGLTGNPAASARGVEKQILDHLQRSKRGREGRETAFDVANLICREGKDPRGVVIRMAIDDAVELGYLERVKQDAGAVAHMRGKGSTIEPHADLIAALEPAAQELAVAWRDFRTGEEPLAKQLRSTTFDGIEAKVRDRESVLDD
jgi:hypothetical protein